MKESELVLLTKDVFTSPAGALWLKEMEERVARLGFIESPNEMYWRNAKYDVFYNIRRTINKSDIEIKQLLDSEKLNDTLTSGEILHE